MFIDFAEATSEALHGADLCIVGSGAAGITLAREFIGHPGKVLLIESGDALPDPATDDLYRGTMAPEGKVHVGIHEGRARVFGGTTTLWGGQARPLAPIDFEQRDWVTASGWPFSADELKPYHERAGAILGLRDVDFGDDLHRVFGVPHAGFDPEIVEPCYSRWSPQPNFATAYRTRLAAAGNITVVRRANVTGILLSTDGTRVDGLELRGLGIEQGRVARAKFYVVCCGGIETPRLLLASERDRSAGVGNAHDLVGRYFQDHVSIRWAEFVPSDRSRVNALFNSFFRGRTKYYPLLAASEAFQRRHRILNISAAVVLDPPPDAGTEVFKRLLRSLRGGRLGGLSLAEAGKLLGSSRELVRWAYRIGVQRRSYADPRSPLYLGSTIEQEPDFRSRVLLDTRVDALGMPRVILDWRLTPLLRTSLVAFARAVRGEFQRVGLGAVNLYPWLLTENDQCTDRMQDVYHHMGTTRMHADPRHGVVDADCRVHRIENLYIGSSSVFPTGGHSNPTFTLLLLCFRLADRLKKLLEAPVLAEMEDRREKGTARTTGCHLPR